MYNSAASSFQQPPPSSELFSQLVGFSRGATEALSQAETLCGQFAALSRRNFASSVGGGMNNTASTNTSRHPAEDHIDKIEDAMQRCSDFCSEARRSPLWSVTDMATLQSLSALQRQRLESMRSDVDDAERQLRILDSRYQPNLTKFNNTIKKKNLGGGDHGDHNHVNQVLQQSGSVTGQRYAGGDDPQQDTEQSLRGKERESIHRVATGVRQLVSESNAALAALRSQRERVQGTDSKLSQVLTSAGVAQSVVRQLERMTVIDRIIVFGGISGLCCLMLYLWIFV